MGREFRCLRSGRSTMAVWLSFIYMWGGRFVGIIGGWSSSMSVLDVGPLEFTGVDLGGL